MHKIFGIKENVKYVNREGAYLIPIHNKQVGVVQTYYVGEVLAKISDNVERDHAFCWGEYEQLKDNMFVEMQNRVLERVCECIAIE